MPILWRDSSPGDWSTPAGYYNVDDQTGMQTYMGSADALPRGTQATMPHSGGEGNAAPTYTHDPYANAWAMRNGKRLWDSEKPLTPQEQALIDILTPSNTYLGDPRSIFGQNAGFGLNPFEAAQLFANIHQKYGKSLGAKSPTETAEAFYKTGIGSAALGTGTGPRPSYAGEWTRLLLNDYFAQPQFKGMDTQGFVKSLDPMLQNWNQRGYAREAAIERQQASQRGLMKAAAPGLAVLSPMLSGVFGPILSSAVASTPLAPVANAISSLPSWAQSALKGAAMSGISGGNPLKGALMGGLGGLGGEAMQSLGINPQLGSFLAKQGMNIYRQNQAQNQYNRAMQQRQLARMSRGPFPQRTV